MENGEWRMENGVTMNLIVAIDENWAIGNNNELLIKIKEDMKYFQQKTINNIVVMGRKTFESLPGKKPLKNRINIVLTRDKRQEAIGMRQVTRDKRQETNAFPTEIVLCHTVEEVLKIVKTITEAERTSAFPTKKETFIIGGEQIYNLFLPYCEKAFITKIFHKFEADKFIPNFTENQEWELIEESKIFETDNGIKYQFLVYFRNTIKKT